LGTICGSCVCHPITTVLLMICVCVLLCAGKAKLSVTKCDVLSVSAVATACEQSYRTGLPVQLSLNSPHDGDDDVVVDGLADKSPAVDGAADVLVDGLVELELKTAQ